MVNFSNKTALITGAGTGIGEAISYEFARLGTNLILTGLDLEELKKVGSKCEEFGVQVNSFEINLENRDTIEALIGYIHENKLTPSIFILNAGISQRALTLETDFSTDLKLMNINYLGSVYLIKGLKELILNTKNVYIGVNTSISGIFGFPLRSAYASSKRALFGFFESLELEYSNIHVTFIIPGRIKTNISKSAIISSGEAFGKMDPGQENGMDVNTCARIAVKAMRKGKKKKLIGGKELLMVFFYKYIPCLFYKLAQKVSPN